VRASSGRAIFFSSPNLLEDSLKQGLPTSQNRTGNEAAVMKRGRTLRLSGFLAGDGEKIAYVFERFEPVEGIYLPVES